MLKTTVLLERRRIFDKAVREKTYGRMRMALYQLAPSLVVQSTVLNGRLMGCYDAQLEAITIDRSMTLDDKKCVLIHELGHWVFDDDSQPPYGAKRERATRKLTASTLIRAEDYRQAELMYEGDMFLMANDLGVNPDIYPRLPETGHTDANRNKEKGTLMRGRILKTITATTLAGIMLVAGSGCGSNQPTTTASSTPTVDVIKQIEEDCGIRSQRGETVFYEWWSYDRDDDTVQCLLNVMPEDVYEQYNGGKGASADAYMDDGDASYEDTVGSGDYRWTWHIYYFGSGSTFKTMSNIRVEKR